MYTKIVLLMAIAILISSCTELAMLSSGAGLAISHNTYAKAYNGLDFLTIIRTEKDIKTHVYDRLRGSPPSSYPSSGCVSERERDERQ